MADYEGMTADELRAEAKRRKLATAGSRQELLARLEENDGKARPAATVDAADTKQAAGDGEQKRKSQAHLMLKESKVDGDRALDFAAKVRKLAEELDERLAKEVGDPLTDMEAEVDDPSSGRLVASSQRLRSHVADVRQALLALSAAAGALGQDAIV